MRRWSHTEGNIGFSHIITFCEILNSTGVIAKKYSEAMDAKRYPFKILRRNGSIVRIQCDSKRWPQGTDITMRSLRFPGTFEIPRMIFNEYCGDPLHAGAAGYSKRKRRCDRTNSLGGRCRNFSNLATA